MFLYVYLWFTYKDYESFRTLGNIIVTSMPLEFDIKCLNTRFPGIYTEADLILFLFFYFLTLIISNYYSLSGLSFHPMGFRRIYANGSPAFPIGAALRSSSTVFAHNTYDILEDSSIHYYADDSTK